jgi:hypothetical protein
MLSRIKTHMTPASLLAMVALFVALGGVSYAAATIGSAQIKNNSVKSVDIKNGTIAAKDIRKSTRNALRGQQGPQGVPGPPGGAAATAFAVVNDPAGAGNATLVRGRGVISVTESTGVLVRFDRDVSGCAWVANKNQPDTGVAGAGWAQVGLSGTGTDILDVRTRNSAGTLTDAPFHVAILC